MYFFGRAFLSFPLHKLDDTISTFTYEGNMAIFLKMALIVSPESCKYSKPEDRKCSKYETIESHDAQYQSLCPGIFCSLFFSETVEMDEVYERYIDYW
jgi:hypothetical protein